MKVIAALFAVALITPLVACAGGGGREIEVVATDSGCTPDAVEVAAGEKVTFVVVNRARGDRELEGIEGTKLEEVLVPAGRTRKINFTAPKETIVQKLACYIPDGPRTVIELEVTGGTAAAVVSATVDVDLNEWTVKPSVTEVKAGRIRFVARNSGGVVHELAVVVPRANGDPEEIPGAEVEDVKPLTTAELVIDLKPGRYQLVCLVEKGEFGSDRNHYEAGMHADFVVR